MENEIKVNEFVRTEEGYIGKLVEYIPNALNYLKIDVGREIIHCDNSRDNFIYTRYGFQFEHSPNLIKLIEVGDYVNGEQITDIWNGNRISSVKSNFNEEDIQTIVTKEMMESISYTVTKM